MSRLKTEIVPVTPFQQNCTIVWDAETMDAAVIDPGGDVPKILRKLESLGLVPGAIWLTHGHLDHAGGVEELREALPGSIDVLGPDKQDAMLLEHLQKQGEMFGVAGLRNVTPTRYLVQGDRVSVGSQHFDVLHCPGHTPGHIVFVNTAARFAQLGDVLFRGSVGRTDFPYGDHATLIDSIQKRILPLGDDMAFICGHGPGSTVGAERRSNPFLA